MASAESAWDVPNASSSAYTQAGSVPAGIQKKMGTGTGWVLKSAMERFRHYMVWLLSELLPYFAVVGRGEL